MLVGTTEIFRGNLSFIINYVHYCFLRYNNVLQLFEDLSQGWKFSDSIMVDRFAFSSVFIIPFAF